jgi:hypothetical protein
MNNRLAMLGGLIPLLILLVVPHVNAESDSKRASDGFNDGSNAARSDTSFNPACDPTGAHTSDGQHTSTYCKIIKMCKETHFSLCGSCYWCASYMHLHTVPLMYEW